MRSKEKLREQMLKAWPFAERFEKRMRKFFGALGFLLVNSGSSANLLMVSTLTSPMLENPLSSASTRD